MVHEPRPHRVRPVDPLPSGSRVPPLRKPLRRGSQMAQLLRLGSVPIDGFRPADLPRKPPRYRSVPAFAFRQALPHGIPLPGGALDTGRRQRIARLEDLCRFRPSLDSHRAALYARDPIGVDLDQTLYALDSTTIDLCLSLFPWAKFRRHKAAVKMHTLLDLHGNIPTFIRITDGKTHDVNILDEIGPEPGAFYVMDRAYVDFERLFVFTLCSSFFVVRTKKNILLQRRYSHPVDRSTGVRSDQTVILGAIESAQAYPDPLRRVSYFDTATNKRLQFLTNNFVLPALTIAEIYRSRWQVELFFRWIKQHLRIKKFYGASENAVKTQIWIAVLGFTCWSRSCARGWAWRRVSTKSYRFSALPFSRKRPFYRPCSRPTPTKTYSMTPTN